MHPGLIGLPNVVLAPHIASASHETRLQDGDARGRELPGGARGQDPADPGESRGPEARLAVDLLLLDRVSKRFSAADPPAVDGLSLRVAEGEILALLGPSGCGKTTTLRLIAGLEDPDAGTITLRGQVVAGPGRAVPPEERGIGIVFQDYALFPHLTVADNVAFGLPRAARRGRVEPVLDLVGLGGFGPRYPHELSGGQQQRVALARALAPAPALMLLDEPFSNLDADLRAQMRDEVERILRTSGTTAVFVTHDQEEAFTLADRVGVLQAGRIEQLAPPQELYHRPATRFVAAFVGAADFLPGLVTAQGIVTEVGTFANVDQLPAGGRVDVMIRPDDITFVPQADGTGTITRRYFRGSETVYCIRLPSGDRVHSSQPSASVLPTGMRVRAEAHVLHVVALLGEGLSPTSEPPPKRVARASPRSKRAVVRLPPRRRQPDQQHHRQQPHRHQGQRGHRRLLPHRLRGALPDLHRQGVEPEGARAAGWPASPSSSRRRRARPR